MVGGLGNAGVRIEHNEHWQGLVDKHRVDMNGTRRRQSLVWALVYACATVRVFVNRNICVIQLFLAI